MARFQWHRSRTFSLDGGLTYSQGKAELGYVWFSSYIGRPGAGWRAKVGDLATQFSYQDDAKLWVEETVRLNPGVPV